MILLDFQKFVAKEANAAAHRGLKQSPEVIAARMKGQWGRKDSPETQAKKSAAAFLREAARKADPVKDAARNEKIRAARANQIMPSGEAHHKFNKGSDDPKAIALRDATRRWRERQKGLDVPFKPRPSSDDPVAIAKRDAMRRYRANKIKVDA